ncbi:MAG: hypothetical protein R3E01_00570 [Pirellulaceae bacterium]|nr:hypothetical protein [Planctomycetales bacterium]
MCESIRLDFSRCQLRGQYDAICGVGATLTVRIGPRFGEPTANRLELYLTSNRLPGWATYVAQHTDGLTLFFWSNCPGGYGGEEFEPRFA